MGTIIGRSRKDGSKAFTAQIVIKKDGVIVHREAQTFDRKPAANAWIVKREAELKRPGGLDRKENPTLAAAIDRYIAESKNVVHGTKAQVFKTLKSSDLGEIKCSEMISSGRSIALANCRSEVVQCRFSSSRSSSEAAIMAIASAKDFSIKTASSLIRISSSFPVMDGDAPM
jgi:hypothetical protein